MQSNNFLSGVWGGGASHTAGVGVIYFVKDTVEQNSSFSLHLKMSQRLGLWGWWGSTLT